MSTLTIDVADTPSTREFGLQFYKEMPEGKEGMLFNFQHPQVLSFWMKNTYMPLDIAFIQDGVIVKTEQMVPLSLKSVSSGSPCSMALEVPAGKLAELGASVGSKVDIDWEQKQVSFSND